jgi:hypothetical protein
MPKALSTNRSEAMKTTFLKTPLGGNYTEEINVLSDFTEWPLINSHWSPPILINGNVYYYVRNNTKRIAQLCQFDLKRNCWQAPSYQMKDHVLNIDARLKATKDGRLCLYGDCSLETCADKSHFYLIELKMSLP